MLCGAHLKCTIQFSQVNYLCLLTCSQNIISTLNTKLAVPFTELFTTRNDMEKNMQLHDVIKHKKLCIEDGMMHSIEGETR